jgi:hypothetical protein
VLAAWALCAGAPEAGAALGAALPPSGSQPVKFKPMAMMPAANASPDTVVLVIAVSFKLR